MKTSAQPADEARIRHFRHGEEADDDMRQTRRADHQRQR
jgi:hypothetical protein